MAAHAAGWVQASAVGWATAAEIDDVGIIMALGRAASRAVDAVSGGAVDAARTLVILDGNHDYLSLVHRSRLTVRTVITCAPGEQFAVQRELRERLKNALDSAGVMGPPAAPFIGPTGGKP